MKVFFTASQRAKKYHESYFKNIYSLLSKLGYTHVDNEIINVSAEKYYEILEKDNPHTHVDIYKKNLTNIDKSDICVFESSFNSLSIGFLIEKSLEANKPTIVLHLKDNAPAFLVGTENEKLILSPYTPDTLQEALTSAVEKAISLREKRFNFFISPDLLNYLNEVSRREKITKSTFIRNLILEHRRKNKKTLFK